MNCQEIEKYCLDYCDNNLSSELRTSFDEHLQQCHSCRNLVNLTHLENEALADPLDIPALSPDFNARLLDRIQSRGMLYPDREAKPNGQYHKYLFNRPYVKRSWALIAAALLLVLLIPSIFNQGLYNNQQEVRSKNAALNPARYDNTAIEKTSLKKVSDESLNQESSQPKYGSAAENNQIKADNTQININQELQLNAPANQQIPMAVHEPQDLVPGNGSSREVNKSKLNSRLQSSHDEGLKPYPENIPVTYELVLKDESNGQYIYQYRENGTEIQLCIIITPLVQQQFSTTSVVGTASESAQTTAIGDYQKSDLAATTPEAPAAVLNSSNKDISSDNIQYNLTVSGNLPQDKIEAIASTITLSQK